MKKRKPARDPPGGAARDGCYRECCCTWDVSKHAWFQDGRYYRLITILDDATSEIYYAQLVAEEGTRMLMPAIREVIEKDPPHSGLLCTHRMQGQGFSPCFISSMRFSVSRANSSCPSFRYARPSW